MFVFSISLEVCEAIVPGFHLLSQNESKEGTQVAKDIKAAVRKMVTGVIDQGISLDKPRKTERYYRLRLPLPTHYTRTIQKLANATGATGTQICESIVDVAIAKGLLTEVTTVDQNNALTGYLNPLGFKKRQPQLLFFECLSTLESGEIGIVEASTGVGKSLGILSAACEHVKFHRTSAVIAVPSKTLIYQFKQLYEKLSQSLELPELRVILGRNNFVATDRLKQALMAGDGDIDADREEVVEWLNKLGDRPGYIEELAEIITGAGSYALGQYDKDEPAEEVYQAQFKDRETAGVILTTHAMIASHLLRLRLRESHIEGLAEIKAENRLILSDLFTELGKFPKHSEEYRDILEEINALRESHGEVITNILRDEIGLLPHFSALYIDEAHAFDDSMDMIFNSTISLKACYSTLKKLAGEGKATKTSVEIAKSHLEHIKRIAGEHVNERIFLYDESVKSSDATGLTVQFASACLQGIKSFAKEDTIACQLIADCKAIKRIKDSVIKYQRKACMDFSPIIKNPRISLRQKSLKQEYNLLWSRLDRCALVSATLYTRQIEGESSQYIRKKMFIADHAAVDYSPIRPSWLTSPVTQCLIPSKHRNDLIPPGRRDKLSHTKQGIRETEFLHSVANELKEFLNKSVGGTLVLCTSYRMVDTLSGLLDINREIIKAERHMTVTRQKQEFCQSSLRGNRPVWLALGAAWTGLDINGVEYGLKAKDDNLLTDLVIVKIPFVSVEASYMNSGHAILEASLKFKQGLGRLVRREGLPVNRRIMVMDGRLSDPYMAAYTSIIRYMLSGYTIRQLK